MNVEQIRKDFPILNIKVNGKPLIYLDNAATSQKPRQVIGAMADFYQNYNSNIHRSIHKLGEEATLAYEKSHKKVADFINADFEEIVFTRGTTESINLLAYSLTQELNQGDEIIITQMEHHSNFVPWQQLAKKRNLKLKFIEIDGEGKLKLEQFSELLNKKTKIVSITHASNVLGTINPVEKIAKIVKEKSNAYFIVDGAQSVPHMPVDVKKMGCDFLAFSGHKMLGPTGIGVLYGKKELLARILPFQFGGDMIKSVSFENAEWNAIPERFEAGTQNVAGAVALAEAIKYIEKIGIEKINNYEEQITMYALDKLSNVKGMELYSPPYKISSIISFNLKGIPSHDVASLLDDYKICIRAGHHCTMPLMKTLKIKQNGTARASFSFYNTKEDVDKLAEALNKINKRFNEK